MKLSLMGRITLATLAAVALGLGMSACGGGTIGFMWVLGQQFNQITGFKVDDFSGNLTQIIGSPFSTNGSNPVSIVVKPGGRYVYVINQGVGGGPSSVNSQGNTIPNKETSGGIALYSVGGDGVLTFQQVYQTQGASPVWGVMDSGGTFLYVADKYSPEPGAVNINNQPIGSISVFQIDNSTGRLVPVNNLQENDKNNNPKTYFNIGTNPLMMRASGGCLFTLQGDNSIFPYAFGSNGQITIQTPGFIPTGAHGLTSINANGSNIYLTDAGTPTNPANQILPFTVGSQCSLTSLAGGAQPNQPGTSNPTYSLVDNGGKFLYVLNQSTTDTTVTTPFSSLSAFNLNPTNGQLTPISGSPYKVGSNPVCMVEDPTNQYLYVSNRNDGTVSGFVLDQTRGELSSLSRGSTFPASGIGSCLAISGNVD